MMLSLADEILNLLPKLSAEFPLGPTVPILCEHLAADSINVRRAMVQLDTECRAIRYRFKQTHRIIPLGYQLSGLRVCTNCHDAFKPPTKSKRLTCSRFCHSALAWKSAESRERRMASMRAERQTPAAKERVAAHNRRRWSKASERKKLSEWNKKRWADPVVRAQMSIAIQAAQGTPAMRKLYSDLRKEWWKDPARRKKMMAAMKACKSTPEARAKFSKLLRERWQDPVMRAKYMAHNKRNSGNQKGAKQSPEHVRKRTESRRRTMAEKSFGVSA